MKAKLRLPLSSLLTLDNSKEFNEKTEGGMSIQKARSEVLDAIMRKFIGEHEIFNTISHTELLTVKSRYIDYLLENRGWGEHSLDMWISMVIEVELGEKKNNSLPEDTWKTMPNTTEDDYRIPTFLLKGLNSREEKVELVRNSIKHLLTTTSTYYKKETTRAIIYETNDSFYFYIRDLKGYGTKLVDRLVEFSVNYYLKQNSLKG